MGITILADVNRVDNLHDPVPFLNRDGAILGIMITCMLLALIFASGRLWIRVVVMRTAGVDDIFVLLSVLSNLAAFTVIMIMVRDGLGKHFLLLGLDGMETFLKRVWLANGIYNMSTALIKLALLFQYLRILDPRSNLYKLTASVIVIVSLWGIIFTVLAFVPCVPIYNFWHVATMEKDTATRYGYGSLDIDVIAGTFIGHSASNMFLDLVIFCIPIPFWLGRHMASKTRSALLGLFILGAIVNACSIFRLVSLHDYGAGTMPTFDPSWYGAAPVVLSALEINLAAICASLPVFWPIIKSTWEKRIVVTHEVEITRESRQKGSGSITGGGGGAGSADQMELDLHSLNVPPASKPWDCMGMEEIRPMVPPAPSKMWIQTADQGLKLTPKTDITHSYWAGSGNKPSTQDSSYV